MQLLTITDDIRKQILGIANSIKYELNDIEFRQTGIRYGYWKNPKELADKITNIVPCDIWTTEDDDCGVLYFLTYKEHRDLMHTTSSSHDIRYTADGTEYLRSTFITKNSNPPVVKNESIVDLPKDKEKMKDNVLMSYLKERIRWLEDGLAEIVINSSIKKDKFSSYKQISNYAQSILDGEPTTADKVGKE